MRIRLGELRRQGQQFLKTGQHLAALRVWTAILRRSGEDFDTRMALADTLALLGAKDLAGRVYEAAALLCMNGGRPLVAIVACRALQAQGGDAGPLIARLSVLYGRGSTRLAEVGARLNQVSDELEVDAREFRREQSVAELVEEAGRVGADLGRVGELPLRFVPAPVLSELSPPRLVAAARAARVHRLPPGHVLFRQGEAGQSCFLVARGKLRVLALVGGQAEVVATLTDDAIVGEMSLITGSPRSATVEIVEETDLIEVGPEALAAMAEELPAVAGALDRVARRRWMSNVLRTSPVFRAFSEEERREVLGRCEALKVPAGTILFATGERARGAFVVVRGEVGMVQREPDSAPRVLSRFGSGATLGLQSCLHDRAARVSATTLTPATLLFLPGRYLKRLAQAVPEFVQSVQAAPLTREVSQLG